MAEIYINVNYINANDQRELRSTTCHELGHALGLGHVGDQDIGTGYEKLMYPVYSTGRADAPTVADKNAIIYLYSYR